MEVVFLKKFSKDLDKITQFKDRESLIDLINLAKNVAELTDIPSIKKLKGFNNAYRIRSGNYRIGIFVEGEKIQFARIAHRKDIYKIFP